MFRCYSLHVSTDGVNGHAKCLEWTVRLVQLCWKLYFLVHLNTICSSSDTLRKQNIEPENTQRWERDYQRREMVFMQEGTWIIHFRKTKLEGIRHRSLKSRILGKKGDRKWPFVSLTIWWSVVGVIQTGLQESSRKAHWTFLQAQKASCGVTPCLPEHPLLVSEGVRYQMSTFAWPGVLLVFLVVLQC